MPYACHAFFFDDDNARALMFFADTLWRDNVTAAGTASLLLLYAPRACYADAAATLTPCAIRRR